MLQILTTNQNKVLRSSVSNNETEGMLTISVTPSQVPSFKRPLINKRPAKWT